MIQRVKTIDWTPGVNADALRAMLEIGEIIQEATELHNCWGWDIETVIYENNGFLNIGVTYAANAELTAEAKRDATAEVVDGHATVSDKLDPLTAEALAAEASNLAQDYIYDELTSADRAFKAGVLTGILSVMNDDGGEYIPAELAETINFDEGVDYDAVISPNDVTEYWDNEL
jgi:hypothetical protein